MAYLCLHFTRNHKELKNNTPYLEDSIRHIEDCLKTLKQRIEEDKESDEVDEASKDDEYIKSRWKFQEILFNDKDATRNRQEDLEAL
ncbi:hypothetical protein Tco_1254992 [Tanacetum coccineum]